MATPRSLPIVEAELCTGCGRCVEACGHGCLALIWACATLERAADCTGEGRCAEACESGVIRMWWVEPEAKSAG